MKSAWSRIILSLFAVSVVLYGCNKNDDDTTVKTTSSAGKGGTTNVIVYPVHDSLHIDSCMVYIKYNADTATPAITVFDDSLKAESVGGIAQVKFVGLKQGNYLVYGHGWDIVRSQDVKGSVTFNITTDNTTLYQTLKMVHIQ